MADSVSNAQVQDVLSSIRRLVSEEGRSERREVPESPAEPADRLVLTPALRVADSSDMAEPKAESPKEDKPELSEQWPPADDDPCWDEFEQAVEAEEADADFAALDDAEMAEEPLVLGEFAEMPEAEPVEDVADENDEVAADLSAAESLAAKIAALEAVIGRTPDQWEPDDTGADAYAGTEVQSMEWEDTAETDLNDLEEDVDAAEASTEAERVEDDLDEAEVDDTAADPEDTPPEDVEASEKFEENECDLAEAEAVEESTAEAQAQEPLALTESPMDEEALRELVSDIVREELQGALGERITRNVRKLVRREIQRALTAKELE